MRLEEDDNFDEPRERYSSSKFFGQAIIGLSLFVLLIFGVVCFVNRESLFKHRPKPNKDETLMQTALKELESEKTSVDSEIEDLISGNKIVSDDLDIWEEYSSESEVEASEEVSEQESSEKDISQDGLHTCIIDKDGNEEWVAISPYLPKNEYDYTCLVSRDNKMSYYVDGKKTSYLGIDISKDHGYVDFNQVIKDGVDYVMIRLGARGYGSGQLVLDDCYADNIKRATDAGLKVGVYFCSQAVTEEEAIEEADMVIQYLEGYSLSYPVAYDMESVQNDTARIDALTKEDKTKFARAFITRIQDAGYNTVIYGDKEWILKKINYAALSDNDIWLSQERDVPDYPYRFTMWQYSGQGEIDGVAGNVNLNISFIDYSIK